MSGKAAYAKFLRGAFWRELTAEKKRLIGECEECGRKAGLQSHHVRYPKNWNDTKLEDLKVLCRGCHMDEHGIERMPLKWPGRYYFLMTWGDRTKKENEILNRTGMLHRRMYETCKPLRDRDIAFLHNAIRMFPPTEKDAAVTFHALMRLETSRYFENPDTYTGGVRENVERTIEGMRIEIEYEQMRKYGN